jgi:hypothetical protein
VEAAVEVLRPPSRCEAAVEVSRLLSRCEAAVEVSRPAHVFVLLLKTAVEAKILLSIIQGLFVVVCDCLPLCAIVLPCARKQVSLGQAGQQNMILIDMF